MIAALCLAGAAAEAAPSRDETTVPLAPAAKAVGEGAKPAAPRADFRIIAFGSSSTQGVGASSPAMAYPAQVERLFAEAYRGRIPVTVLNRGIGGEDIDDMIKRLQKDVLISKPDLVIWQAGSNDPLRGVPVERFKKELRDGIAAIRSSGAEIMLMEPQWCPAITAVDTSSRFVDAVRDIGTEQHIEVLRRYDLMKQWLASGIVTRTGLVGPDGLHMTDRGYSLLAKAVFDNISTFSPAFRGRAAVASASPQHN